MTRDKVLAMILRSDGYVSGESISRELGITRAAVNAAVKQIKELGYDIESSTRKGYRLLSSPDLMNLGEIMARLPEGRAGDVTVLDTVDSTNTLLKEMARQGAPAGSVVISDEQTGGKGRRGRSFLSPSGTGIYLSYLMIPKGGREIISEVTAWTAVAVREAVSEVCGVTCDIKWVNDPLINNHKICGILTELSVVAESGDIDNVIIGIGINVNHKKEDFPEELRDIATSISAECGGKIFARAELAACLIGKLDELVAAWPAGKEEYLDRYREACITTGSKVSVFNLATDTPRTGEALGINDDFALQVRFDDTGEEEAVRSGEVSVRGLYGYT